MINKVEIIKGTSTSEIMFFDSCDFSKLPNKRIVPLFGPNGSGKTTLINSMVGYLNAVRLREQVKDKDPDLLKIADEDFSRSVKKAGCVLELDNKKHMWLCYTNSIDNFAHRESRSIRESYDPRLLGMRFDARSLSEGQSIVYSLYDLIDMLSTGKNGQRVIGGDILAFIDEMDSGLSLDNLDMFLKKLKYYTNRREDLQVILSFNNPRMLKYFPYVISMYTGEVLELHSEEDMLAEFKKHEKAFNKARKLSNGRPRVYE